MISLVKVLEEVESPCNGRIQVVKTFEGTRILAGGVSQSGWLVRKIWDSALKRLKGTHPDIAHVLIMGLGGGSAAEIIQLYWPEAKIIGVDIDSVMVSLGKKYLSLEKIKNLKFIQANAEEWVAKENKQKFDLVLVDLYQGGEIPDQFKDEKFLLNVKKLLKPKGVAAFNHFYSSQKRKAANLFGSKLRKFFSAMVSICPEANIIFLCFGE